MSVASAHPMLVILCHPDDAAALWLHSALRARGVGELELVAVEQLVYSRRIVHRLGAAGAAGDSGAVHLADGRVLQPEAITGLVNRVRYLPTQHFAAAEAADRAYATEELSAFLLAWLDGIAGRVINPPLPFDPGGGAFQPTTVMHLAAMAGLPIGSWRQGTAGAGNGAGDDVSPALAATHATIVLDGQLFGPPLPGHLQDGCRRLAALLAVPLLQVLLHRSREAGSEAGSEAGWRFVGATGAVDFRIGGAPLAAALSEVLAMAESHR